MCKCLRLKLSLWSSIRFASHLIARLIFDIFSSVHVLFISWLGKWNVGLSQNYLSAARVTRMWRSIFSPTSPSIETRHYIGREDNVIHWEQEVEIALVDSGHPVINFVRSHHTNLELFFPGKKSLSSSFILCPNIINSLPRARVLGQL